MSSEKEIFSLLLSFNSQELIIKQNKLTKIFTFTKSTNNEVNYCVVISIKDNNLIFTPKDKDNINDSQFAKVINNSKLTNSNQLLELIDFIKKENVNSYCAICQTRLEFQSDMYMPCGNDKCIYKFEELIIGNPVIEKFNEDEDIAIFLLESAIDAISCPRKYDIFEPFPTHFLKYQDTTEIERGKLSKLSGIYNDYNKNFTKIDETIKNFTPNSLIKILTVQKTDTDLANVLGKDLYILIRFILMSCKVTIQKDDHMLKIKGNGYKIYKIIHPSDKEDEFKLLASKDTAGTQYLFHGSNWANWYSITRNGLKNCSGTKLMTAGAAHGAGIYLSDNIQVSYGYGASGHKSVVGVFEIINKDKYLKTPQIYVCDNDKALIQRYLLIMTNHSSLPEINSTFNTKIHENKMSSLIKYNQKSIKKIIREYKTLMKMKPEGSLFRIEVNPDYPFDWKIFIHGFSKETLIAQDMERFSIKEIELEIKFPQNYPFSPPFLRVVRPRFMYQTGRITSAGSWCNELVTEKGWIPTCTTESLLITLISEIIDGGGRIDPHKYHIPYTLAEAEAAFIRVAKSHGWM
ncbi:ubiquitin-conjugating enzyme E2 [Indivirus ILV1]|uniref:E2 ubiquitin-conjugating enzyme n=1 Tax=Indivirus ILV1 TaxID=1977633 RepID=A0A1V0SE88_9VIRU|nr:ubiquitin-conjugating enzyme E2 [Indivirus ILV1]